MADARNISLWCHKREIGLWLYYAHSTKATNINHFFVSHKKICQQMKGIVKKLDLMMMAAMKSAIGWRMSCLMGTPTFKLGSKLWLLENTSYCKTALYTRVWKYQFKHSNLTLVHLFCGLSYFHFWFVKMTIKENMKIRNWKVRSGWH